MKAHLMYKDSQFSVPEEFSYEKTLLLNDFELNCILETMAKGQEAVYKACRAALLNYVNTEEEILYRQEILKELLNEREFATELYAIADETITRRKKEHVWLQSQMNALFRGAIEILRMTMEEMRKLRALADKYSGRFSSKGLSTFVKMLKEELSDSYFAEVDAHLNELAFNDGMLISARFGEKLQGEKYTLRRMDKKRLLGNKWTFAPSITISSKDEEAIKDLELRKARVISDNVNVIAQATDHVLSFFTSLRDEMGFYVGCLNLYDKLKADGLPVCFPTFSTGSRKRTYTGLYDVSLPMIGVHPVGNDMDYAGKTLFVITGANQGGKSTFLRSLGQSQVMMQAGMFVGASSYCCHIASGIFAHFRKEEDAKMDSGKLDEELERMSKIVDAIKPGATILFNESFAATNEREGAEIGRQITQALLDSKCEVFTVTHLYTLSHPFFEKKDPSYVFLRAERLSNGDRSFRLSEGEPQKTGYGDDVYSRVFHS